MISHILIIAACVRRVTSPPPLSHAARRYAEAVMVGSTQGREQRWGSDLPMVGDV